MSRFQTVITYFQISQKYGDFFHITLLPKQFYLGLKDHQKYHTIHSKKKERKEEEHKEIKNTK